MNVFDSIREKVLSLFDGGGWIKWIHEGTPRAYDNDGKIANIRLSLSTNHCAKCLNMNGCCFPKNNMSVYPLHFNCHCWLMPVNDIRFKADCDMRKFKEYAFKFRPADDKSGLFLTWGYDIIDADWLLQEYCRQAKEKYSKGEFTRFKLDDYGQHINIRITLPRKDGKGYVTLISGWLVYPDGEIKLTTPYGDK